MTKFKDLPEEMGIREFAEYLKMSILTIKRGCKKKEIEFHRVGKRGDRFFYKQDLINFINSKEVK